MITGRDIRLIKKELLKLFPETRKIRKVGERKSAASTWSFYLYLDKGKQIILKMTPDYLENHNFEEIKKHLQRNIYYVMKSNINKTIYLMKNFEIEVVDGNYA